MAAIQELNYVSHILDRVTTRQGSVGTKEVKPVAKLDEGAELLYGLATYPIRGVGDEGRPLTEKLTTQPVLFVRHKGRLVPLAYAEDVVRHPLKVNLTSALEEISFRLT